MPILNNILINCKKGIIRLSATNLEMGINTIVRGKVETEGGVAVPAKTLADYVSLLPDEKIELSVDGQGLKIVGSSSQTTIKSQDSEEFPLIPSVDRKNGIVLKAKELRSALGQVVYAVAQDESRPEISGVYLRIEDSKAVVAATDSYRLAERKIILSQPEKNKSEVVIPTRTVIELSRIISDETSEVTLYLNDNQILFICDGVELVSRIIEGQYPDYQQIIPQDYKSLVTFSKDEAVKAVKSAAIFSKTGINDVSLKIDKNDSSITIASANTQLGESKTKIKASIEGESNETVFNHRYLLDGLSNVESPELTLSLIDGANPGTIKPKNKDEFLYIIMPIKQ